MRALKNLFAAAAMVVTFGAASITMTSEAAASTITDPQTWELNNGAVKKRGVTVFHNGERNLVDFDVDGAEVFFTYDGDTTATIHGTAYDDFLGEFVDIYFTYNNVEQDADLGLVVRGETGQGVIGNLALGAEIYDVAGYSFAATVDANGVLKLDGWLSDGGDWHAFGTQSSGGGSVPAPGGLALILIGLAGLGRKLHNKKS